MARQRSRVIFIGETMEVRGGWLASLPILLDTTMESRSGGQKNEGLAALIFGYDWSFVLLFTSSVD